MTDKLTLRQRKSAASPPRITKPKTTAELSTPSKFTCNHSGGPYPIRPADLPSTKPWPPLLISKTPCHRYSLELAIELALELELKYKSRLEDMWQRLADGEQIDPDGSGCLQQTASHLWERQAAKTKDRWLTAIERVQQDWETTWGVHVDEGLFLTAKMSAHGIGDGVWPLKLAILGDKAGRGMRP